MDRGSAECGVPLPPDVVQMAHGGGGRRTRQLLDRTILPALDCGHLATRLDSAVCEVPGGRIALTTDSYVITPRFFPGGNIGSLAVFGTVNDLAVVGAAPRWLSLALIAEEGLELAELERIVQSIRQAAERAGVEIVTGDTKVVDRGHGHGLYVNTSGVGLVPAGCRLGLDRVCAGDAVLVSGDLGRHGVAILSVREGLRFETDIESDVAPLAGPIAALLADGVAVRVMRDLTRGGLGSALNELCVDGRFSVEIEEGSIPIDESVAGACELLGLDPLYVANEGRFVAIVAPEHVGRALAVLKRFADTAQCASIGRVTSAGPDYDPRRAPVVASTRLGPRRVLDLPLGEQLPRIC